MGHNNINNAFVFPLFGQYVDHSFSNKFNEYICA